MALAPVDKLRQVAKILTDVRLDELVKENQRLRLALFWRDHSHERLREVLEGSIQRFIRCECKKCIIKGCSDSFKGSWECSVQSYFEKYVNKHGFSAEIESDCPYVEDDVGESCYFYKADVHFVLGSSVMDWVLIGYGNRFHKVKSIQDPELIKLKELFKALGYMDTLEELE
jgi:hypothetical protein